MNFIDLIYQHNLKSLSGPIVVQAYKSLMKDKKDKFLQQIYDVLEGVVEEPIIVNGKIIDANSLQDYMNGLRDDVSVLSTNGTQYITDIDDQIHDQIEEFAVINHFLDSLSVQTESIADRVTYFVNSIQLEDITSSKALSLFDYYRDVILNSTNVSSAIDTFVSDISITEEDPEPINGNNAFTATGVNPFLLLLNSIDFPYFEISDLPSLITQISPFIQKVKASVRNAVSKTISTGIDKFNTTFVDTIDFQLNSSFDDLSCDQSCILLGSDTVFLSDQVNPSDRYFMLARTLRNKNAEHNYTFNYAVPLIGSTLYFACFRVDDDSWDVNIYLKKHLYSLNYAGAMLSTLLGCIERDAGATATIEALSDIINSSSVQPDTYPDSTAEGFQYLNFRRSESLIMLGLILFSYGHDSDSCYQQLVSWYRPDGYGNYPAEYVFRIDYGSSGVPESITNRVWYDEAIYINTSNISSLISRVKRYMSIACPGAIVDVSNEASESPLISFEVSEFLKGVLSIKSDQQLVIELKTILGTVAAVVAAVTVAAAGIKLRTMANSKYLQTLNNYKSLLANPNTTASELLSAYRKSNRWSKIASNSLVRSASGWYVSAPSASTLSVKQDVAGISANVANTTAQVGAVREDIEGVSSKIDSNHMELSSDVQIANENITAMNSDVTNVKSQVQDIASDVTSINENVTANIEDVKESLDDVSTKLDKLDTIDSDITVISTNLNNVNTNLSSDIQAVSTVVSEVNGKLVKLDTVADQVTAVSQDIATSEENILTNIRQTNDSVQSVSTKIDSVLDQVDVLSTDVSSVSQVVNEANDKLDELDNIANQIDVVSQDVSSSTETISAKVQEVNDAIESASDDINDVSSKVGEAANESNANYETIKSDIQNLLTTLQNQLTELNSLLQANSSQISTEATGVVSNITTVVDLRVAAITAAITALSSIIK